MSTDWFVLICFLVVSSVAPGEAMSLVMTAIVLFYLVDPFSRSDSVLFPGYVFFGIIILIGLMGFRGKVFYDYVKDLWYVCNAVLPLLIGYMMMQRMVNFSTTLNAFVVAAVIVSAVHLVQFANNYPFLSGSLVDIRSNVSPGYFMAVIGISIILADWRFRLGLLKKRMLSLGGSFLCFVSVSLSFSRTLWVALLTAAGMVILVGDRKRILRVSALFSCLLLVALGLVKFGDFMISPDSSDITFKDKILSSFQELKITDYISVSDINKYWRGFESYKALQTYSSGTVLEHFVGKGYGANVDLGFSMMLDDVEFERIPILHNGYMYLLVKTGAVGLVAYLLFFLLTWRVGMQLTRQSDAEARFSGLLLLILTLIVVETTFVISGLFNKSGLYQVSLLMGILMRYAEVKLLNVRSKGLSFAVSFTE